MGRKLNDAEYQLRPSTVRKLRAKRSKKWNKGEMSRSIVLFCIRTMTAVLVWAIALKTLSAVFEWSVDLSDVLTFAGAFFGGELVLLAFKRIFAKKNDERGEDDESGQQSI